MTLPAFPPPDVEPHGSCDMGGCNNDATIWVWCTDIGCWLPSCAACDPSKPKPVSPRPNGYRCSCGGTWFDDGR